MFKPEVFVALCKNAYGEDDAGRKKLAEDLKTIRTEEEMNTFSVQKAYTVLETMMFTVSSLITMQCDPPKTEQEVKEMKDSEKEFRKNVDIKLQNALRSLDLIVRYQFYPATLESNFDVVGAIAENERTQMMKTIAFDEKRAIVNKRPDELKEAIKTFKRYLKC